MRSVYVCVSMCVCLLFAWMFASTTLSEEEFQLQKERPCININGDLPYDYVDIQQPCYSLINIQLYIGLGYDDKTNTLHSSVHSNMYHVFYINILHSSVLSPLIFFFCLLQNPNPAYRELLSQQIMVNDVIEDVVTFENGGLNNSVDAMTEVARENSVCP